MISEPAPKVSSQFDTASPQRTERGRDAMITNVLIGVLSTLAISGACMAAAPAASASSNWPLCGAFSLFSEDQCDAIKYCLNNDDPICEQVGNQPTSVPPQ